MISNQRALLLFGKIVEREKQVISKAHIDVYPAEMYILGYFSALYEAEVIDVSVYHTIIDNMHEVLT